MLSKKYHAIIIFTSILAMLLLLGLHLLGFGFAIGTQNSDESRLASAASLQARNATINGASSNSNQQAYRHPILYDKQTGSTSEIQASSVNKPTPDFYPLDHYQQFNPLGQQQQQTPILQSQFPLGQPEDFFGSLGRAPGQFGPGATHMRAPHLLQMPLPPPPPMQLTTQPPISQQQQQRPNEVSNLIHQPIDSLTSASNSLANLNGEPSNRSLNDHQQQPIYYTPPIFAYNPPSEQAQQPPASFLGGSSVQPFNTLPAADVDDYNTRQARLRQQQQSLINDQPQQQQQNLLADPQQQLRHKQQMLDRQFLFNKQPVEFPPIAQQQQPQQVNQSAATTFYPDPASQQQVYNQQRLPYQSSWRGPPYAQPASGNAGAEPVAAFVPPVQSAQNRILGPDQQQQRLLQVAPQTISSLNNSQVKPQNGKPPAAASRTQTSQVPNCAIQATNQTKSSPQQPSICHEDSEYPLKEIMRALEAYAKEHRSIEPLLPQSLVWLHLGQLQQLQRTQPSGNSQKPITLDALQVSIGGPEAGEPKSSQSENFESLCQSQVYMTQPRRAKNLFGQWKVVVNLPGHKYRGVAVSQMVRLEECTRPQAECAAPQAGSTPSSPGRDSTLLASTPKSRCLQVYDNQRLLAWSAQQDLHVDIFRVPISCSCHIRRHL